MEFPLKLLIVMVIISISTPLILGAVQSSSAAQLRAQVTTSLENVASKAQELVCFGPGNSCTLNLDLTSRMLVSVDEVKIGDALEGENAEKLTYRLGDGTSGMVRITNPPVRITSGDGGALLLGGGKFRLDMACRLFDDGKLYVEISVLN